jgi:hypothetical protein
VDRAEQRHLPRRRFRRHVGFSLPRQGVAGAERQGGQRIQACPKRGDLFAQQWYLCAVLAAFRSRHLGGHPSNTALTRVMPCLPRPELNVTSTSCPMQQLLEIFPLCLRQEQGIKHEALAAA